MALNLTVNNGAGLPAVTGVDPFEAHGEKLAAQLGQFLSFDKGYWLYGQDKNKLPNGTKLAANLEGLQTGWRRWFGGKVTDELMDPLVAQQPRRIRSELGDNDPALWERDERSQQPRDPWVETEVLQMVDGQGEAYIYSASSKGGRNAIGNLCKLYGQERRQRPGMVPIVELGGDSYMHSNSEYGLIHVPVLKLVGWTAAEGESEAGAVEADDPPFEAPKAIATAAKPVPASSAVKKAPRF